MADDESFKRDRKVLIDAQNAQLFGKLGESESQKQQRFTVAQLVRECHDAGFDTVTLIQSLTVGACWLADQTHISRDKLVKMIQLVKFPDNVTMSPIIKGG